MDKQVLYMKLSLARQFLDECEKAIAKDDAEQAVNMADKASGFVYELYSEIAKPLIAKFRKQA